MCVTLECAPIAAQDIDGRLGKQTLRMHSEILVLRSVESSDVPLRVFTPRQLPVQLEPKLDLHFHILTGVVDKQFVIMDNGCRLPDTGETAPAAFCSGGQ